jgi:diaminopimelate decarboxylase
VRVVASVGWSGQFGLRIRGGEAFAAFERMIACRHLDPCGLHIHLGTGIRESGVYLAAIREMLEFADELRGRLGVAIRVFDFGGGFGVPTVRPFTGDDVRLMLAGDPPGAIDTRSMIRLDWLSRQIGALLDAHGGRENADVLFEPGRSITSTAQTLLLRVIATKPAASGGRTAILDGGKNVAMPLEWEYHEIFPASNMRGTPRVPHGLFGPLCHPGDVIRRRKDMPVLAAGDVVALMDAGAYFVPNQMNFSFPRCGAILVQDGAATVIREHESLADIVRRDFLEPEGSRGFAAAAGIRP